MFFCEAKSQIPAIETAAPGNVGETSRRASGSVDRKKNGRVADVPSGYVKMDVNQNGRPRGPQMLA